jgi:hypothetical protein
LRQVRCSTAPSSDSSMMISATLASTFNIWYKKIRIPLPSIYGNLIAISLNGAHTQSHLLIYLAQRRADGMIILRLILRK